MTNWAFRPILQCVVNARTAKGVGTRWRYRELNRNSMAHIARNNVVLRLLTRNFEVEQNRADVGRLGHVLDSVNNGGHFDSKDASWSREKCVKAFCGVPNSEPQTSTPKRSGDTTVYQYFNPTGGVVIAISLIGRVPRYDVKRRRQI
jgi:hypothetical protein